MLRKLKNKYWRYAKLHEMIEGEGASQVFWDEHKGREQERQIRVDGFDLTIRSNTPDLEVVVSSLIEKEYEDIRCDNPKFIIDAGANIGTSAVYFARRYPAAQIVSIEPEDSNFELLKKNIQGFNNITPIKAAIWGTDEKRTIQNRGTGYWGFTVADTENDTDSTGQEIECVTVRSLMEQFGVDTVDIFKMDIEGGEKDVLNNSGEWIDNVRVLTVELHDRIAMGCTRAFYLATKDFKAFEMYGEKVTAYRDETNLSG